MTTAIRSALATQRMEARLFAVGVTAAAAHPSVIADLVSDAASGHPAQRMTVGRVEVTGTYHTHWIPTAVPRYLRVQSLFAAASFAASSAAGTTLSLSIYDSLGGVVLASNAAIPLGLKGDGFFISPVYRTGRIGAGNHHAWLLDIDALVTAGLSLAASTWRFRWVATLTPDALTGTLPPHVEAITVEEVPRFLIDDAESYGQVGPVSYRPRAIVATGTPLGLTRLWETVRVGLMLGLRTYHGMARAQADPWLVASPTFVPFSDDTESAGVAAVYRVRPRVMRPGVATRVRFLLRYQITGASGVDTATVRLTTLAGTYDVVLTDVSGTLVDSPLTTAYLAAGAENRLSWSALRSNAASTLKVCARIVVDYPEA